jgi:hypothetical protein
MIAALALSNAAYGEDERLRFRADLSAAQEVLGAAPPFTQAPIVTETVGTVRVVFNDDLSAFEFRLVVRDGLDVQQAHLHCGRPGENGPVVVFLFPDAPPASPGVDVDGVLATGTRTNADIRPTAVNCNAAIDRTVNNIASLAFAARKGLVYANVHTVVNPGGEIRGQLIEH